MSMEPGTQASISINHPEVMFSTIDLVSTQETPTVHMLDEEGAGASQDQH